ncbi:MAG: helix-turn-helix transcriptional regulator [Nitrospira sp.]|nr:helix-turn-helix transcriptional regulator [Nitrospira sp.]
MTASNTFGQTVADARKQLKMSQKELAAKIKREEGEGPISAQYLNDIEHDRRVPVSPLIGQFAAILKIDKAYLHFLAGRVPEDLRRLHVDQKQFGESMVAFRRSLTGRGKSK